MRCGHLRRYWHDFGDLGEKHLDEVALWGRHLAFAVALGDATLARRELHDDYERLGRLAESLMIDDQELYLAHERRGRRPHRRVAAHAGPSGEGAHRHEQVGGARQRLGSCSMATRGRRRQGGHRTMKLVAIAGSPRKNGNSTSLMRLAVEGAQERGATAEVFSAEGDERRRLPGLRSCKRAPMRSACRRTTCTPCTPRSATATRCCWRAPSTSTGSPRGSSRSSTAATRSCPSRACPRASSRCRASRPARALYVITTQADDPVFFGLQVYSTIAYGMTWIGMKPAGQLIATGLEGRRRLEGARRPDRRRAGADRGLRSGRGLSGRQSPRGRGISERATNEDE